MIDVLERRTIKSALSIIAVLVMSLGGLSACAQNQITDSQTPITILL